MSAAVSAKRAVNLIVADEVMTRRNRTVEQLEALGLRVARTYLVDNVPPGVCSGVDALVVIVDGIGGRKVLLDRMAANAGIRCFVLPHQKSRWTPLVSWVGDGILASGTPVEEPRSRPAETAPEPVIGDEYKALAESYAQDAEAAHGDVKRLTADVARTSAELAVARRALDEVKRDRDRAHEARASAVEVARRAEAQLLETRQELQRLRPELAALREREGEHARELAAAREEAAPRVDGDLVRTLAALATLVNQRVMTGEEAFDRLSALAPSPTTGKLEQLRSKVARELRGGAVSIEAVRKALHCDGNVVGAIINDLVGEGLAERVGGRLRWVGPRETP